MGRDWLLPGPLGDHLSAKEQTMIDPTLDRLREMFGIEATDPESVFAAIEAYDRRNLRTIYAQDAELQRLRAIPYDEALVLLRELEDRERLTFGQPLPETSDVVRRFAAAVALPEETPQ